MTQLNVNANVVVTGTTVDLELFADEDLVYYELETLVIFSGIKLKQKTRSLFSKDGKFIRYANAEDIKRVKKFKKSKKQTGA